MSNRSTGAGRARSVERMFRKITTAQLTFDIVFAVLCVLLRSAFGFPTAWVFLVLIGMAATLALRRVSPGLALGVAWGTVVLQMGTLSQPDVANLAILPMLFATAAYGSNRVKWLGLASAGAGAFLGTVYVLIGGFITPAATLGLDLIYDLASQLPQIISIAVIGFFSALAVFVLSWTLGFLTRTWRSARESRVAQAVAEAEQAQAQREVGIEQERTRIARDMHDVVAHSLAVVIAQADGARYARHGDPAAVDEALTTIATTAREALGDVRILLGQLRHSEAEGPQPVLADLDRMIDQVRASGLSVLREELGTPAIVGTGQQLAVYRIVQEALTNALRHGDTAQDVVVRFTWGADQLMAQVISGLLPPSDDDTVPARAGHGLDGMRERAILAGGSFSTERTEQLFIVTAKLPATAAPVLPAPALPPAVPTAETATS